MIHSMVVKMEVDGGGAKLSTFKGPAGSGE